MPEFTTAEDFTDEVVEAMRRRAIDGATYAQIARAVTGRTDTWRLVQRVVLAYCDAYQLQRPTTRRQRYASNPRSRYYGADPSTIHPNPNRATRRATRRTTPARPAVRTIGVEIECRRPASYPQGYGETWAAQVRTADALVAAGIDARPERYTHRNVTWWKVTTDSSSDLEIVAPPLPGNDEGIAQLRTVMRVLRQEGHTVGSSEGMHVHVYARSMTPAQRGELFALYTQHQATVDRFVPASRRDGGWCHHWNDREIEMWVTRLAADGPTPPRNGDRYRSLNLCPFSDQGTFEFRQHQGTLSGRKAEAWVRLLLSMFDAVQSGVTSADVPHGLAMLGTLVDRGGLLPRCAAYLTQRAEAFTPPSVTQRETENARMHNEAARTVALTGPVTREAMAAVCSCDNCAAF